MNIYKISDLARDAIKNGIILGDNPSKRIRFYISEGLLEKPQVIQSGKRRILCFNSNHLSQLQYIDYHQKQGLTLDEIKEQMNEKIFWSDYALEFIEKYRSEIPEGAFTKGKHITRSETAFIVAKYTQQKVKDNLGEEFLKKLMVDQTGNPIILPLSQESR